jgi:hypothetical protein
MEDPQEPRPIESPERSRKARSSPRSRALGAATEQVATETKAAARSGQGARSIARGGSTRPEHRFDALPDTLDFRDRMFEASLVRVERELPLERYRELKVPVLDQGAEGACTGFALASVVHALQRSLRQPDAAAERQVSPWMLYHMAKRYDEWPGERYAGSSARGAMKAWHKHGVCARELWKQKKPRLDETISRDAASRPLGAYLRVNHKDLVALHAALSEVGVLFATTGVHDGWDRVRRDGLVPPARSGQDAHAIALVGYDRRGFWFQNSWGPDWGQDGFGLLPYDDWLANAMDVWVARLGVPIELRQTLVSATGPQGAVILRTGEPSFDRLRPHIVSLGNDGELRESGTFGTGPEELQEVVRGDLLRFVQDRIEKGRRPRVLLYAHGGLVSERAAIQRTSEYLERFLEQDIYPLSFLWKTDAWTTLSNLLADAFKSRRAEGLLDAAKDFLLDRLDDALEPLARSLGGRALWEEMKENALLATTARLGGARRTAELLDKHLPKGIEIHLAGHSAGAVLLAPLTQLLAHGGQIRGGPLAGQRGLGRGVASLSLWAPACTLQLFQESYRPAIESGAVERLALFTLTERAERDDHCARLYNKSLLYLVSHAFEPSPRIPFLRPDGTPLLGLARDLRAARSRDKSLERLFKSPRCTHILAPNELASPAGSKAKDHGGFDDDPATIESTLAHILRSRLERKTRGARSARAATHLPFQFRASPEKRADQRRSLGQADR